MGHGFYCSLSILHSRLKRLPVRRVSHPLVRTVETVGTAVSVREVHLTLPVRYRKTLLTEKNKAYNTHTLCALISCH